uniref:carbonic anhydrase n=2 Tax=Chrysotila carterae TaxID=13221 RepID=A0A7S4BZ90_CHRCT
MVNVPIEDPESATPVKAVVVTCARLPVPIESIFDPLSTISLRVCGGVIQQNDALMGSAEFVLEEFDAPKIIVMGNEGNDVIATAVARAMIKAGREVSQEMPHLPLLEGKGEKKVSGLLLALEGPAEDALEQAPFGSFEELCAVASKLNVWNSIEHLLSTSRSIVERVRDGRLQVHGAYLLANGKLQLMGAHPTQQDLISSLPSGEVFRTANDVAVPADEALAALYAGNQRYIAGKSGQLNAYDKNLMREITDGGQKPYAVVLGCADSRCPVELMYDGRPGDIFVLRNAGNTLMSASGSTLGSAEYAVGPLDSKLVMVTGHTNCGAVTATVKTMLSGGDTTSVGGSIGKVLDDIVDAAKQAIKEMPDGTVPELVKLATKINVFNSVRRIIEFSHIIKEGILSGAVQVHGSVYDINTGKVEFYGEHPELEKIVGKDLPVYKFRNTEYTLRMSASASPGRSATAQASLQRLAQGNERFVKGTTKKLSASKEAEPFAIILGMAAKCVVMERVFDVAPGELLVQRVAGSIAGRKDSTLFASVEYAIGRWKPKLMVVLADSSSKVVRAAIDQASGDVIPTPPKRGVLDRVMVSAMRAKMQVDSSTKKMTAAGRDLRIQQLTTELNAFYTIEQLLQSDIIREAVVEDGLELHAAVLDEQTGVVKMLGEHPALEGIVGAKLTSE